MSSKMSWSSSASWCLDLLHEDGIFFLPAGRVLSMGDKVRDARVLTQAANGGSGWSAVSPSTPRISARHGSPYRAGPALSPFARAVLVASAGRPLASDRARLPGKCGEDLALWDLSQDVAGVVLSGAVTDTDYCDKAAAVEHVDLADVVRSLP